MLQLACIIAILLLVFVRIQRRVNAKPHSEVRVRPKYSGMTTKERLRAGGLVEEFSAATDASDLDTMIAILQQLDLPYAESRMIAETIIERPNEYGF